ncbi:hypothetical protein [Xanthobacter sediminis]
MNGGVLALVTAAALIVGLYALLARGLLLLAEPVQRRALYLARTIAAQSGISPEARRALDFGAYSIDKAWVAWLFALLLMPFFLVGLIIKSRSPDQMRGMSKDTAKAYIEFNMASMLGILANSPGAFALALVQLIFFIGISGSTLALSAAIGKLGQVLDRLSIIHVMPIR